jgi:hypothetical protein
MVIEMEILGISEHGLFTRKPAMESFLLTHAIVKPQSSMK